MERVSFQNKGNTVVGNLFKPEGSERGMKYPAVVVTHPYGAVKEQVPTTYAKLLAAQGFITLVFDASYQGESGGEPHFSEIDPNPGRWLRSRCPASASRWRSSHSRGSS